MRRLNLLMLISGAALLCACGKPADAPARAPAPASAASTAAPWLGRWQGPEGTYLDISGGPGTYSVTVKNLDGPRSFEAKAGTDTLVFTRDGVIETVRAGSGPETGMKWLADKKDCLIVKTGEGYCRG
ncbi:hypothetical protein J2X20_003479 [Pelomonas saccharophila]|uniref:Lipoprotein n=1 Tax=Roseateles saccharophilus TaxID=304 RepID=A0ABU1YS67_ROSSA|nr:hypothetical protein [Roseateles saccharophilus]MDR7270821.1 hypothetical protein [Roseateles saccharophilus]